MRSWFCRYSFGAILCLVVFLTLTCTVSAQIQINPGNVSPTEETNCWVPCRDTPDINIPVPLTECKIFYVCREGRVTNRLACSEDRTFDVNIGACNHAGLVNCVDPTCPPTDFPTTSPTHNPTISPSISPTESPTESPSASPTHNPSISPSISPTDSPTISPKFASNLVQSKKSLIEQHVLKSYTADGTAYASVRYTYEGFFRSLLIMGNDGFGADFKFMLWDADKEKYRYGLVNLAAFLANCMVEAISDDTCDELNWQQVAGRYAISNSCGQEGRSYQEETCGIYSCTNDANMEITAVHAANDVRAPPPMECRPGSGSEFYSGYWDTNSGTEIKKTPYANTAGRIDVEGCCYWGRGALLTRSSCSIGKLNYFLGARADREGRASLYPNIDFCVDPEATCASSVTDELRWTTAFFEWSEHVQRYNNNGWAYEDELNKFFDGGMVDDSFIDTVGKILSLGCHEDGCSDLEVRMANERKANFYTIINDVFGIGSIKMPTKPPTSGPTPAPLYAVTTSQPTPQPLIPHTTPKPTPQPQDVLTNAICQGQSSAFVSIEECKEYVQCSEGRIVARQSCSEGLLFDSAISGCNWDYLVICNAPTKKPTPKPTQQPLTITNTIEPTQQTLPQQPPTNRPSINPVPLPTQSYPTTPYPITPSRPIFETSRPIGITPNVQPSNTGVDEQNINSDEPTYGETLIPLEGNGAKRSMLFKCTHLIYGVAALHLLLAMV